MCSRYTADSPTTEMIPTGMLIPPVDLVERPRDGGGATTANTIQINCRFILAPKLWRVKVYKTHFKVLDIPENQETRIRNYQE